jgi:hypothetical protein
VVKHRRVGQRPGDVGVLVHEVPVVDDRVEDVEPVQVPRRDGLPVPGHLQYVAVDAVVGEDVWHVTLAAQDHLVLMRYPGMESVLVVEVSEGAVCYLAVSGCEEQSVDVDLRGADSVGAQVAGERGR